MNQAKTGIEIIRVSVLWLIAVNLIPVAGVFLLGWDVSTILFPYWAENVVIGMFNLVKMKKARGLMKNENDEWVMDPEREKLNAIIRQESHGY